MASEYAHCYGGDASREYLSVEDATSNGGDASREYFSGEDATTNGGDASRVGKRVTRNHTNHHFVANITLQMQTITYLCPIITH